ncbi:MAG: DUF2807 domain-containing protein [Bacteroidales bacterium]|nr:DUF2807 domain-containing protein [Bacteroidales bacterium]
MKIRLLLILSICSICMFSCKKAPLSVGETVTQTRSLQDFHRIKIYDDISLTFVKSDTCYIEITTGSNLIDNITTSISDSTLCIRNENTLNWIRPYDYTLHARLYFKEIDLVYCSTAGYVDSENQFNNDFSQNTFIIDGASGDLNILINNCKHLFLDYKYGTSKVSFSGNNNNYFKVHKKSYGIVDARDYKAERVNIVNGSSGDCYIHANNEIISEINNLGDIYYKGNPAKITETYGPIARGRLIPLRLTQ